MKRRILFVRLPHFPTERFIKAEASSLHQSKPWWDEDEADEIVSDAPLVLVDHGPKGTRISASSREAMSLGLWPAMKLADARTMVPVLRVEHHNQNADRSVQMRLAHWLTRWSPSVSPYASDGFLIDITGCAHLFGGEAALTDDVARCLAKLGFTAKMAIADYTGAAIALVDHAASNICILTAGHQPQELDDLPVEALRLEGSSITLLKRLGLKKIGDVRPIPRTALERRFNELRGKDAKRNRYDLARSVQMRLDQLSGQLAEPVTYTNPPRPFRVLKQCPEMALEQEAVGIALGGLLNDLCDLLERDGKGARLFRLIAYRADGGVSHAQTRLSEPTRNPSTVVRLFRDHLEQIDCGFGVDLFALEAWEVGLVANGQHEMGRDAVATASALSGFADIVSNRSGPGSVVRFISRSSHVPERMQRAVPVSESLQRHEQHTLAPAFSSRPLRLLSRPEPASVTAELPDSPPAQFIWRKVLRKVVRSRGPERILPEWWSDDLKTKPSASFRDYYDVEDTRGLRYWIFRAIHELPVEEPEPIEPAHEPEHGWDHGARLQNPPITTQPVRETQTVRRISWFVHGLF